jgi:hypothetical protein
MRKRNKSLQKTLWMKKNRKVKMMTIMINLTVKTKTNQTMKLKNPPTRRKTSPRTKMARKIQILIQMKMAGKTINKLATQQARRMTSLMPKLKRLQRRTTQNLRNQRKLRTTSEKRCLFCSTLKCP